MELFFRYLVLAVGIVYAAIIFYFYRGLQKLQPVKLKKQEELPPIGVVVAARNEEAHIEKTVRSLAHQNYPRDRFTIVVVDDRSEDNTLQILQTLEQEIENLRVMMITERKDGISPKKHALLRAVATLDAEFVAMTDADCIHHKDWLRTYASAITPDLGVATGMTIFSKNHYTSRIEKFWQEMQNIEHISEHLITAGASGQGVVLSANGNNLLCNRSLYTYSGEKALNGKITSGDDFFLIQTAEKRGYRTRFLVDKPSIVHSIPEDTISKVINQRARWASKIRFGNWRILPTLLLIFLFYLAVLCYPLTLMNGHFHWGYFALLLGLKVIPDTIYIASGITKFHLKLHWINYLAMQILHIPFIVITTTKGILFGFTWKGTKYKQ